VDVWDVLPLCQRVIGGSSAVMLMLVHRSTTSVPRTQFAVDIPKDFTLYSGYVFIIRQRCRILKTEKASKLNAYRLFDTSYVIITI
jgi:hypothetical protein